MTKPNDKGAIVAARDLLKKLGAYDHGLPIELEKECFEVYQRLDEMIAKVPENLCEETLENADIEIQRLIDTGGKSFTMQIPARPKKDTDLVLSTSQRAAEILNDALRGCDE